MTTPEQNITQFFVPTLQHPSLEHIPTTTDINKLLAKRIKLEKLFPYINWNIVLTNNKFYIEGEHDPIIKVTTKTPLIEIEQIINQQ